MVGIFPKPCRGDIKGVHMMTSNTSENTIHTLYDGRMTRTEAAQYLGLSPKTLAMWVSQSKGPKSGQFSALDLR